MLLLPENKPKLNTSENLRKVNMKIQFLKTVMIGKSHFKIGVHEVSDEILETKAFHKYLSAGWVCDPDEKALIKPESIDERNKRLAEKLVGGMDKSKALKAPKVEVKPDELKADPKEESMVEAEAEEPKEESKPKSSSKKKW